MDFFKFLLSITLGFLLSGAWFGLYFIIGVMIQKFKIPWLSYLNKLLASLIPVFFIASTMGVYPIQIRGLQNIRVYVIAIVTIVITTAIITSKKEIKHKKSKNILIWGLDGLLMEIPQRLMMQSFVYGILKLLGVSSLDLYTIIATGLIWCMGIVMQTFLLKKQFDENVIFDILSSLVFSLGIGYVYQQTGLIIISMIAHFCERILSCYIFNKHPSTILQG
jgi:hypothetical protein